MNVLVKNTFRKIRKSFGRFLSIMLIIALGISVFIGLRESTSGMLYTADNYYDEYNLMDFKITSTYGLNNDDINSLNELKNISEVIPSHSIDVLVDGESIRVYEILDNVNEVKLISGRMPKKSNECLGDYYKYKINDKIKFERKDLNTFLNISSCKVVGLVESVLHVRDEKGISNVGNGKLISFIFVNSDSFNMNYYTEAYIIAKDTKKNNSYYDDYKVATDKLYSELEKLKPLRETIRYEEVLNAASKEISNNENKLNEESSTIKKELSASLEILNQNKIDLSNSRNKLNKQQRTLNEFEIQQNNYFNNLFNENKENKRLILDGLANYGLNELSINGYLEDLKLKIANLKIEYDNGNTLVLDEITNLETLYNSINDIASKLVEINKGSEILNNNYNKYLNELNNSKEKLKAGYDKLNSGDNKLQQGVITYNKSLEEFNNNILIANEKIAEAKEKLNNIEKPKWYLLDRSDNGGYINYKDDVVKVGAIANILPIFFILVVILVVLNTLTRMIEEERTEIGILKSNGYSKTRIIFSYILYVLLSSLLGLSIGLTIGYSIIPKIVYGLFLSRYYVPKLITIINPIPFSLVVSITILLTSFVTIIACYKELKSTVAILLRPLAPKSGKKVFLEKIKPIWNKLNFTWKISIRNLFRYKKRIIMTSLGVSGCTALLLTGLGLNDSINSISNLQFTKIIKYDEMFIFNNEVEEINNDLNKLLSQNNVNKPLLINQNAYTYTFKNKTENAYLVVSENDNRLNEYISLYDKDNEKKLEMPEYGAIISEQMADQLNKTVGDQIKIRNSDNELFIIYISGITKNYVSNYIYMSKSYYQKIFNKEVKYNAMIASSKNKLDKKVPLTDYNILLVNYTEDIVSSFDSFVKGLNKIIILIIVCASLLALTVLYNLTIINVSERIREVATLKVLGFSDKEVSNYIYRETFILTIMGIILGLILGIFLHKFIIYTAQTDNILFINTIKWYSYIIAGIITILFSLFIQLIISSTLKKIDMTESLKSVE